MKHFKLVFGLLVAFGFGSCAKQFAMPPSSPGNSGNGINISDDNKIEDIHRESSYDIAAGVSDLSIDADMGISPLSLVIEKSPDNKIHVIETFNEEYFTCDAVFEGGKRIRINAGTKEYSGFIQINPQNTKVIVRLPVEAALTFTSINGSLELNNTDLASVSTNIINGTVLITDGTIRGRANIQTVNGDALLTNGTIRGNADIQTVNGTIYYRGVINGTNVNLNTANGAISIFLNNGSDVTVDIESKNTYPFYNGKITLSKKITEKINNGGGRLSARTANGQIICDVE